MKKVFKELDEFEKGKAMFLMRIMRADAISTVDALKYSIEHGFNPDKYFEFEVTEDQVMVTEKLSDFSLNVKPTNKPV